MARVKRGVMTRKRHNEILRLAKGYRGAKHRLFRQAHEAVMHAGQYAYRDRRQRKRDFRRLWITRISAACRLNGFTYNRLIEGLTKAGVQVDRKILAEMAVNDAEGFARMLEIARAHATLPNPAAAS
ncbi:MAG: 50S ribosomal protein L20 [Armatimonadota bacterium]|jgi:large subunit ribosomal protein L20|nr:50S ribosomal protein L20 [Armatimonadota bacterium]